MCDGMVGIVLACPSTCNLNLHCAIPWPMAKGVWNPGILRLVEEFRNAPRCPQVWNRNGRKQNTFPFESVPPHLRPYAQARFNYYIAKYKAAGIPLTQGKIASLYGNATRYATQVVTGKYRRERVRRFMLTNFKKKLDKNKIAEMRLTAFKEQPIERRMKVLPL